MFPFPVLGKFLLILGKTSLRFQNKRSRHKKAGKNRVLFHSVNEEGKKRKKDQ